MYNRPSTQTKPGTIDKYLSSSYDELNRIIDNIDTLVTLGDGVTNSLKYLGSSTTTPTKRLNNESIEDGDYYFDTINNSLVYYNLVGNNWVSVDTTAAITASTEAAVSANAASLSEIAAAISETNAIESASNAATSEASVAAKEIVVLASEAATLSARILAESAATSAEASKDSANTYATTALNSKSVAEASASSANQSKESATTSAVNASTSESNASASEISAGSHATSALSSKNSATASADSASSSAIAAANSETNSAASATVSEASAVNASASATSAESSATSASNSQTAAANSASSAATDAASALSSKTQVQTSEANVLAAETAINSTFDNFDDRFLGTFATPPNTDNDGNPLSVGAVYYDSDALDTRFWNGSSWDAPSTSAATSATNANNSANAAQSSASSASTSETNASNSASSASTSAGQANTSASEALTSKNSATTSASEALTHKNSASTSASSATSSKDAAATSATAAGTSESNAAASATSAAASESSASSSEAAALASKNSASTSETNAGNSASAASTSAGNASTSETNAANSASSTTTSKNAAATSESNASTSAGEAATSASNALTEANRAQGYADSFGDLKNVMTKAEFFALAEQRKSQSAGSGFGHWGKTRGYTGYSVINNGLYTGSDAAPRVDLLIGHTGIGSIGISDNYEAVTLVNGVYLHVDGVSSPRDNILNKINFPPAPDGTKTYDSSNGTVTQHASSAAAFAAETATNKVITSREDLVMVRTTTLDVLTEGAYPLGNMQYGATTADGFATELLSSDAILSRFGEWDSVTTGNKWTSLTDKYSVIQNSLNNIYSDNGELKQVAYKIQVHEGKQDYADGETAILAMGYAKHTSQLGIYTVTDGGREWNCIPIALVQRRNQGAYHPVWNPDGVGLLLNGTGGSSPKWYGLTTGKPLSTEDCFNPAHNNAPWVDGDRAKVSFIANGDGFNGRPDGKFCDAIYASDVKDLRMSAKKLPLKEIREKYKRMAISGEVRGFEGVPFTAVASKFAYDKFNTGKIVHSSYGGDWLPASLAVDGVRVIGFVINDEWYAVTGNDSPNLTSYELDRVISSGGLTQDSATSGWYAYSGKPVFICIEQQHKQANPTWTDIIGDPANIAATFPDGVEGQWIPVIPDGTAKVINYNRKVTTPYVHLYDADASDGVTWSNGGIMPLDAITNSRTFSPGANQVAIYHYETQAHFTQDDVNSKVLDLGGVWAGNSFSINIGNLLNSSLIGKVCSNPGSSTKAVRGNQSLRGFDITSGKLNSSGYGLPINHDPITLGTYNNTPGVKALDYLSSENSVAKLCYVYKEIVWDSGAVAGNDFTVKPATDATFPVGNYNVTGLASGDAFIQVHAAWNANLAGAYVSNGEVYSSSGSILSAFMSVWNGNGFGDNNQFEIANNQNTMTDDNGNPALYGIASCYTQYFVSEE